MNIGEDKLSISHCMGGKPINNSDSRKIFLKLTRKKVARRIFCATCEQNSPFYVNYYIIHTKSKILYNFRQIKINCANKIKGYHLYNNETFIVFSTCVYSSNVTTKCM